MLKQLAFLLWAVLCRGFLRWCWVIIQSLQFEAQGLLRLLGFLCHAARLSLPQAQSAPARSDDLTSSRSACSSAECSAFVDSLLRMRFISTIMLSIAESCMVQSGICSRVVSPDAFSAVAYVHDGARQGRPLVLHLLVLHFGVDGPPLYLRYDHSAC